MCTVSMTSPLFICLRSGVALDSAGPNWEQLKPAVCCCVYLNNRE